MKRENNKNHLVRIASKTIKSEATALVQSIGRVEKAIVKTAMIILDHEGKVVICGLGKSGHIGQKIVATLCSTGIQAVFMHASEALHGDLGIYHPGDPTILISKSGSTEELLQLIPILRKLKSPLIGLVGKIDSPLARRVDIVIDASVQREADPLGIVPTASTTLTLAIGDALASVLMTARRFDHEDFAEFHPGGNLGVRLQLTASDLMKSIDEIAVVKKDDSIRVVVLQMTEKPQGAALVLKKDQKLVGIITEGDLRRTLAFNANIDELKAKDIMTLNPITIHKNAMIHDAAVLMEDRISQISVLPVIDNGSKKCVGLLRIHDIYQSKLY